MRGILLLALLVFFLFPQLTLASPPKQNPDFSQCIPSPDEPPPLLFGGAKPSSLVLEDVDLLSNPPFTADTAPMVVLTIPQGARVIVFDLDDQTRSWFRVIWPCDDITFTGWVPTTAIRHSTRRVNPKPAPPGCAIPIDTVTSLDTLWRSTETGKIAVVVDLYRLEGGTRYPESSFYITVNGREIRDKERRFTSSGPFLINGEVIGAEVREGNRIGFSVVPPSREVLRFFATIYAVPDGCEFGE